MRRRLVVSVLSAAVGAGAGAVAIALGAETHGAKSVPLSSFVARISAANNKVPLQPREMRVLLGWARKVRPCLERSGADVDLPIAGDSEVVMRLRGPKSRAGRLQFAMRSAPCAAAQGGPPLHSSFVLQRDGAIHIYRPRACLLPVVR